MPPTVFQYMYSLNIKWDERCIYMQDILTIKMDPDVIVFLWGGTLYSQFGDFCLKFLIFSSKNAILKSSNFWTERYHQVKIDSIPKLVHLLMVTVHKSRRIRHYNLEKCHSEYWYHDFSRSIWRIFQLYQNYTGNQMPPGSVSVHVQPKY